MWFKESYWRKFYPYWIVWFMESYWRRCYSIQLCGSWRITDESVTPFNYVVHGELVMKVLPHLIIFSNMLFMETYWRKFYPYWIMWIMESYWRRCYSIHVCGSWRITDESVTPFKYVVHGELLTKVLPHSNMLFMESYWWKYYPIQICGSWRVTDESVTPFKYVVHGEIVMKVLPHANMWFMEN